MRVLVCTDKLFPQKKEENGGTANRKKKGRRNSVILPTLSFYLGQTFILTVLA